MSRRNRRQSSRPRKEYRRKFSDRSSASSESQEISSSSRSPPEDSIFDLEDEDDDAETVITYASTNATTVGTSRRDFFAEKPAAPKQQILVDALSERRKATVDFREALVNYEMEKRFEASLRDSDGKISAKRALEKHADGANAAVVLRRDSAAVDHVEAPPVGLKKVVLKYIGKDVVPLHSFTSSATQGGPRWLVESISFGQSEDERCSCQLVERSNLELHDCLSVEVQCDSETLLDRIEELRDAVDVAAAENERSEYRANDRLQSAIKMKERLVGKDGEFARAIRQLFDTHYGGIVARGLGGKANGDGVYNFAGFSQSQVRSRNGSVYFSKSCLLIRRSTERIYSLIASFADLRDMDVARRAKRMGLVFSRIAPSIDIPIESIDCHSAAAEDITSTTGMVMTDGNGLIGINLVRRIVSETKASMFDTHKRLGTLPSVVQLRMLGAKGTVTLTTDSALRNKVILRRSMVKYDDHALMQQKETRLGIVDCATPFAHGNLNKQYVAVLSARGISDGVFEEMCNGFLGLIENCLYDPRDAYALARLRKPALAERLRLGPGFTADTIEEVRSLRREVMRQFSRHGKGPNVVPRVRIPVLKSRFIYGIPDPTGRLKPGECFVRITTEHLEADEHKYDEDDGDCSSGRGYQCVSITGKVVILRPPCYYAGDARVLKAVDLGPQAAHLTDCLVLPVQGARPIADESSGGDYDGDRFFVCWDKRLIPKADMMPFVYHGEKAKDMDRAVKKGDDIRQRVKYFSNFDESILGRIDTAFWRAAKLTPKRINDQRCVMLNEQFSRAVDGVDVDMEIVKNIEIDVSRNSASDTPIWEKLMSKCSRFSASQLKNELGQYTRSEELDLPNGGTEKLGILTCQDRHHEVAFRYKIVRCAGNFDIGHFMRFEALPFKRLEMFIANYRSPEAMKVDIDAKTLLRPYRTKWPKHKRVDSNKLSTRPAADTASKWCLMRGIVHHAIVRTEQHQNDGRIDFAQRQFFDGAEKHFPEIDAMPLARCRFDPDSGDNAMDLKRDDHVQFILNVEPSGRFYATSLRVCREPAPADLVTQLRSPMKANRLLLQGGARPDNPESFVGDAPSRPAAHSNANFVARDSSVDVRSSRASGSGVAQHQRGANTTGAPTVDGDGQKLQALKKGRDGRTSGSEMRSSQKHEERTSESDEGTSELEERALSCEVRTFGRDEEISRGRVSPVTSVRSESRSASPIRLRRREYATDSEGELSAVAADVVAENADVVKKKRRSSKTRKKKAKSKRDKKRKKKKSKKRHTSISDFDFDDEDEDAESERGEWMKVSKRKKKAKRKKKYTSSVVDSDDDVGSTADNYERDSSGSRSPRSRSRRPRGRRRRRTPAVSSGSESSDVSPHRPRNMRDLEAALSQARKFRHGPHSTGISSSRSPSKHSRSRSPHERYRDKSRSRSPLSEASDNFSSVFRRRSLSPFPPLPPRDPYPSGLPREFGDRDDAMNHSRRPNQRRSFSVDQSRRSRPTSSRGSRRGPSREEDGSHGESRRRGRASRSRSGSTTRSYKFVSNITWAEENEWEQDSQRRDFRRRGESRSRRDDERRGTSKDERERAPRQSGRRFSREESPVRFSNVNRSDFHGNSRHQSDHELYEAPPGGAFRPFEDHWADDDSSLRPPSFYQIQPRDNPMHRSFEIPREPGWLPPRPPRGPPDDRVDPRRPHNERDHQNGFVPRSGVNRDSRLPRVDDRNDDGLHFDRNPSTNHSRSPERQPRSPIDRIGRGVTRDSPRHRDAAHRRGDFPPRRAGPADPRDRDRELFEHDRDRHDRADAYFDDHNRAPRDRDRGRGMGRDLAGDDRRRFDRPPPSSSFDWWPGDRDRGGLPSALDFDDRRLRREHRRSRSGHIMARQHENFDDRRPMYPHDRRHQEPSEDGLVFEGAPSRNEPPPGLGRYDDDDDWDDRGALTNARPPSRPVPPPLHPRELADRAQDSGFAARDSSFAPNSSAIEVMNASYNPGGPPPSYRSNSISVSVAPDPDGSVPPFPDAPPSYASQSVRGNAPPSYPYFSVRGNGSVAPAPPPSYASSVAGVSVVGVPPPSYVSHSGRRSASVARGWPPSHAFFSARERASIARGRAPSFAAPSVASASVAPGPSPSLRPSNTSVAASASASASVAGAVGQPPPGLELRTPPPTPPPGLSRRVPAGQLPELAMPPPGLQRPQAPVVDSDGRQGRRALRGD